MKKFIIGAVLATLVIVGGYFAWTTWVAPRAIASTAASDSAPPAQANDPAMQATIVPAQLNKDGIPESLGSLALTQSKLGKDALNEFAQLHGAGFDLVNGYQADYASGDTKATLWVGQAKDGAAAGQLVKEMADKIGAGNPMFTNLQELTIGDKTIYEVDGQGQLHFFYASGDKIVWLASDSATAPTALHSIWRAIQ